MDVNFMRTLRDLVEWSFRGWTSPAYVIRGLEYCSRVKQMCQFPDGSLVAEVQGKKQYFTHVYLDEDGKLEGECTCPVGSRCKHVVAVSLKAAENVRQGHIPPWADMSDPRWLQADRELQLGFTQGAQGKEEIPKNAETPVVETPAQTSEEDAGADILVGSSALDTFSTDERHILFCLVVVPGPKTLLALRTLMNFSRGKPHDDNLYLKGLCQKMNAFVRTEEHFDLSHQYYHLRDGVLTWKDLQILAQEGEHRGWWPAEREIRDYDRAAWLRPMTRENKNWYEGSSQHILAIDRGLRFLLLGRGDSLSATGDGSEKLSVLGYLVSLLPPNADLLQYPGRGAVSVHDARRLLEVTFVYGRDVRDSLASFMARYERCLSVWTTEDSLEVAALCVWTGKLDLLGRLIAREDCDEEIREFWEACIRLKDSPVSSEFFLKMQDLDVSRRIRKAGEYCPACRLLAALSGMCSDVPYDEWMEIASPEEDRFGYRELTGYPLSVRVRRMMFRLGYFFSDFFDDEFSLSHYGMMWPVDYFKSMVEDGQDHPFPACVMYFTLPFLSVRYKKKVSTAMLLAVRQAFSVGEACLKSGYPTLAAVVAAGMVDQLGATPIEALARKIKAAGGVWLLPYASPENRWRLTLDELTNALTQRGKKKPDRPVIEEERGRFIWVLQVKSISSQLDSNRETGTYRVIGLSVGFQREGKADIELMPFNCAASAEYAACRTEVDTRLLCEGAYYQNDQDSVRFHALIDLLLEIGHIGVQELENDYYRRRRFASPVHEVSFARKELPVEMAELADGSLEMRVPAWSMGLKANYCLHAEREGEYAFYELSSAQRKLLHVFEHRGVDGALVMPAEAKDQIGVWATKAVEAVALGGSAATALVEKGRDLPHIQGDCTPVVQLTPHADGLSVRVGVRPQSGASFAPCGIGAGETFFRTKDDAMCILVRSAAREKAAAEPVLAILKRLDAEEENGMWRVPSLAKSLEALLGFKALGGAVHLEWPSGTKLAIEELDESHVNFSDFKTERDWFGVQGSFTLDSGRVMDLVAMLNALDTYGGKGFVRLSDGQFLHLSQTVQKRLAALKAAGTIRKDAVEVAPAAVPSLAKAFDETGLPKALKESARHFAEEFSRKVPLPVSLQAKLRPYQHEGFVWLARHAACGFGACLADDMGLGKTVQMITLLLARAAEGPSLVVAPASVCGNWRQELARFAPSLRTFEAWEFDADDPAPFKPLKAGDVLITSYGLLVSREKAFLARKWNGVILDEAQAVKNGASKRAHVVKEIRAAFRLAATGTPVENRLTELESLFDFLNPGLLGPTTTFTQRLVQQDGTASESLKRLVAPFILRRLKANVLKDLPPKTEITLPIQLGKDERTAYEACRLHALESLKGNEENRISILAELTRLRRFCCHPSLVMPDFKESAKMEALQELLSELKSAGHRALVFSQFTDYLALVRDLLKKNKWTFQYLDGATPIAERGRAVEVFQRGEGDFFLISLKAGGTGLNLTAANYVVLLDPWWNPAVENQAADRVHRIGQQNPVTVYRLIASKTVEERVLELHAEKLHIAEDVLAGTSRTKLTPERLMRLFE